MVRIKICLDICCSVSKFLKVYLIIIFENQIGKVTPQIFPRRSKPLSGVCLFTCHYGRGYVGNLFTGIGL